MSNEFHDWYYRIPYFTRHWLTITVIISVLEHFKFLEFDLLVLWFEPFILGFQIWRPITALFFYPTSFNFLVNCYFLYVYSGKLENGVFAGKPAEYIYILLFKYLMNSMVMSVLYIWCMLNKEVVVSFWFGSYFRAMYLPWVLMVFNMIVNGTGLDDFAGILVGHLAYFLVFKYPREFGGPALLTPPAFLIRWFPGSRRFRTFGLAPEARSPLRTEHKWGRGYTLGRS